MTAHPGNYQSDRDETHWRPPLVVVNPCSLPLVYHVLTWAPPAWHCAACPFEARDLGAAAAHLSASQWTVGYRPAPIIIDPPRGMADERGDD